MKMHIIKHKTFDKKIWNDNDHLKPQVVQVLLAAAWDFIDYVRNRHNMNIQNKDIKDIILFGSETNYFYTKKSDIDICIVLDIKPLQKQFPNLDIVHNLKLYYYDWTMFHTCKIKGRKVDLNFESMDNAQFNGRFRTGANYSILNNEWIFRPIPVTDAQLKQIKINSEKLYGQIMRDFRAIKRNGFQIADINEFYNKFTILKINTFANNYNQVITPLYFARRKLQQKKIFDILRKKSLQHEKEKFTLK